MTSRKSTARTARPDRKTILPALAALACVGAADAAQITINDIPDSPALIAAFAKADADPNNDYKLVLRWRRDANGQTVKWIPQSRITLKRGRVFVLGSQSNSYPERYIFDGAGVRTPFAVVADAGYKPTLIISGITVQNGYASRTNSEGWGGGLFASNAEYVQISYCKFLNNKSNQPGSGIAAFNTRTIAISNTVVDGNVNDQVNENDPFGCGGQTSGGGGIGIANDGTVSTYASIYRNTVSNNVACRGGGVLLWGKINMNMGENTLSGNKGVGRGGGIFWQGGSGTQTLTFNTIAYNRAGTTLNMSANEKRYGGGMALWNFAGTITLEGNIVAKNTVTHPMKAEIGYNGHDCHSTGSTVASAPYGNYVGKVDNCALLGSAGSWGIGTEASPREPKLFDLLERGTGHAFPLPVHQPMEDSPVRGNFFAGGVTHKCDERDQRSLMRNNYLTRCDIGSVEYGAGIPQ